MVVHPKQREKMAGLALDLSKIIFGSFVLGPFLAPGARSVNFILVNAGFLCFTLAAVLGIILSKPRGES